MATHGRLFRQLCLAAALAAIACGAEDGDGADADARHDVRVHVERVVIDDNDTPVVVLEEEEGTRWLPIWIGSAEARSIALEIESLRSPRPNTHDLARDVIHHLDAEVSRVVVTELRDGTYYAILHLSHGGRAVTVDARPSDAIAIALRAHAPIFVREPLFAQGNADEPVAGDSPRREI
jgi:bifunctional DNase/RNase